MRKSIITMSIVTVAFFASCGGEKKEENAETQAAAESTDEGGAPAYDAKRGEGKHTEETLALTASLNPEMATKGETVSGVKCFSCHKATDEKLVGPGWKGVTARRTAPWIMNFITNPDPMIDKDPEAQAMLEICLVRMPNQSLTDDDAREILEYMRKNDGVK